MSTSLVHCKPRPGQHRSGLFRSHAIAVILLVPVIVVVEGCSSSSPRFKSGEQEKAKPAERRSTVRFATREEQEESRENDRQPDGKEIEGVVSGSRDFKREKNRAITPIDQSKLMRSISKYMGTPYEYGGMSSKGLDCSAYTMIVYQESVGRSLPRSAHEQSRVGESIRLQDLKFGDLIFFNTTGQPASHVGIYLGDDLFAHASVTLGVTISSLQSSYYKNRYESARRVVNGVH